MKSKNLSLKKILRECTCPACGYHVAVPFYNGQSQPLATVAWPDSADMAINMQRYPLDFLRCVDCGHIYNGSFDYSNVPYSVKPNLMFNNGKIWSGFLDNIVKDLAGILKPGNTVIEIGYGDGSFLHRLSGLRPDIDFIGYDPHGVQTNERSNTCFRNELFKPSEAIPEHKPALIISRHVLEHLNNPLGLIESISFALTWCESESYIYLEVPCVDNALKNQRIIDFYYEHNSHFTTRSFSRMLECASVDIAWLEHGYNGEVIFALVKAGLNNNHARLADESGDFFIQSRSNVDSIRKQLDSFAGKKIAIWGGTGKAAAFMNTYGLDFRMFPIVIDSDPAKVGTYVPGTGQEILDRKYLKNNPVDIIIIPMHWRAQDVVDEIHSHNIRYSTILIEYRGQLIDFFDDSHPYRITDMPGKE